MELSDCRAYDLPDAPGVYLFKRGKEVLYVGKATSLCDRVRSYFSDDLIATRGPRVVDMVTRADRLAYEPTPTVLEALVREAALIKKYAPKANVEGKDDKTFLYAVITEEEIPRVLIVRGKDLDFKNQKSHGVALRVVYGPFPSGAQLKEGLRLIRRIFPFFDTPKPLRLVGPSNGLGASKHHTAQIEFNTQIRRYPRLPAGRRENKEYRRTIRKVALLLSGRGKQLRVMLKREMNVAAKEERFEDAARARRELLALDHIQDVSLIQDENRYPKNVPVGTNRGYRIEAYDTAHLSGTNAIGVMAVLEGGALIKSAYRTFRIRGTKRHVGRTTSNMPNMQNDDIASLKEILSRRLAHTEWPFPQAIVVDGGATHKKTAEKVLAEAGIGIPVVAVVKDERHRPREVIGARAASIPEADAVLANAEAHRFSLARHRYARARQLRSK